MKGTTRSAPERGAPRSAKAERRDRRKERKRIERELGAVRRSRTVIGTLAFVPLLAALSCTFGLALFWCGIDPFFFMLAFSSLAGLYIGATIRLIRERRKLRDDSG